MRITHAVLPAAGRGLKPYPAWDTVEKLLHPVIDRDGLAKPVLQILADDLLAAGLERIVVVVAPGEEEDYREHLAMLSRVLRESQQGFSGQREQADLIDRLQDVLNFAVQERPEGYGHAVWCAREQVSGDGFVLALSDHLFLPAGQASCATQAVGVARELGTPVSTVATMPEHVLHRYGVVGGQPVAGRGDLWQIATVLEKPTPTQAELACDTPGQRRGWYLCLSGLHVLPTEVFAWLESLHGSNGEDRGELTPVLRRLAREQTYHAVALQGSHQDIGTKYGLLEAQLERALMGPDRDRVLSRLAEILALDGLREDPR